MEPKDKVSVNRVYSSHFLNEMMADLISSESSAMLQNYVSGGGRLHTKADCKSTRKAGGPKNCVIHRPSVHKLTGSPQILRSSTLIEDQCVHGIGHPNPDSAAYLNWSRGDESWGIHGCDGCCGDIVRLSTDSDPEC